MGETMDAGQEETDEGEAARVSVFVSYSRHDLDKAKRVINLLEAAGFDVWWDGLLTGGENYLPTTEAALEGAECVVALWSQTSIDSYWVRDEAQSGRERGCLVPLSLDGTMPPLGFRQFQMIDISHWNGKPQSQEAEQIIAAVSAHSSPTGEAADLTVPLASPDGFRLSRRALALGGIGLGGAAVLGIWRLGVLPSESGGLVSMAVMPFSNLTGDDDRRWFSDGLSNELRAVLARNPRLRVSAPTSSSVVGGEQGGDFELGEKLGVENILRGSVQSVDDTVRISAELVSVGDGLVRWAESFDRELEDVFAVQSEIAETVAFSLVTDIASEEEARQSINQQEGVGGTEDVLAYEAYLRGHAFYDLSAGQESDRAALAQFDAAISADPEFAAAHAMRSTMLAAIANSTSDAGEVSRLYEDAILAADRAIELAPELAQGHLAMGFAQNNGQLDRKRAFPHYRKARDLALGDADVQRSVAAFYSFGEQRELAQEMIAQVLTLDPLNGRAFRTAAYIAYFARDYQDSIRSAERALDLNPNLASAWFAIGNARFLQGDIDGAITAFQEEPVPIFSLTGLAIAQHAASDYAAAREAHTQVVEEYGEASQYQQAQIMTQWGRLDEAMDLIERSLAAKDPGMLFAPNDPMLDPLRQRPELARLLSPLTS